MNSGPFNIVYVNKPGWVVIMKCKRCKRLYDLRYDGQQSNADGCPYCREELKGGW